jgi:UDP-N-acetylglucosamine 1-carboxyvinyltransferase
MKDFFLIKGLDGKKALNGTVSVNGAKNAVLPAMAGALLFKDSIMLENVPHIDDVIHLGEILSDMGVLVDITGRHTLMIDPSKITKTDLDYTLAKRMRASIILTGPILARFGQVSFPHPGGCVIGARPIDLFIDAFQKMGATVEEKENLYVIKSKGKKLHGAEIFFKMQSVTGTETIMMAAVLAEGKTVIKNAALEPEIVSLAEFLVSCGAKIKGAGTSTIEITGGGLLSAKKKIYKTIPDRIETGSFLILGALAADNLEITNCNPADIEIVIRLLKDAGVPIETGKDFIRIVNNAKVKKPFSSFNIKTHEFPGFPTDLQAPMAVFLTQAEGEGVIFETIFEGRLNYTQDLVKMGAAITQWDTHRAMVKGQTPLRGKELDGPDLRAGLAYILAGIVAEGDSVINNIHFVDRGYEQIEVRLKAIGVDIERVSN